MVLEIDMGKVGLTYHDYSNLIDEALVKLFKNNLTFDGVYGLPRGGLPIAVHISHHLNIPMIMNLIQFSQEHSDGKLLVVDDIVDTGKTFDRLIEVSEIQKIDFFSLTLYYKPQSTYKPDIFVKETQSWIVFPWEPYDERPSEYHQDVYSDLFKSETVIQQSKLEEDSNDN